MKLSLRDLPGWRQNCFLVGTALLGFGVMLDFVSEQLHPHSWFAYSGPLLLVCGSILCLFGKGWIRATSVLAGFLLALIEVLST